MSSRTTNCPNCGGQVEFKAGASLLSVCPYCSSAVARIGGDVTELEILGRVAPLADLGSPLSLGAAGRFGQRRFTIVGQLQLDYGLGPWNEWYAAFDDGAWGWIAEAQGRVYLTFGHDASGLPGYAEARVGSRFVARGTTFTVTERRRATFVSAVGELPFAARPGEYVYYCDIAGPNGLFGTLDYESSTATEPDVLFVGKQLAYTDLFDKRVLRDVEPGRAASAVGLNCPQCGAGVEVRAPDEAQRVSCGTCDSLLDCSKGNELFLLQASVRGGPEPKIPLGSKGDLRGRAWTVYGHLTRSVTYEGVRYQWEEYLLRDEERGAYRWLLYNDGHWTWVDPVHAGDVSGAGNVAHHNDQRFRHYQSSSARVDYLRGEFYWKVTIGEQVGMMDFIRPPQLLSRETSADEVNWSLGTYLDKTEVEEAFKLGKPLPVPRGVAPHQPNPHGPSLRQMGRLGLTFSGVLIVVAVIMSLSSANDLVLNERVMLSADSAAARRPPAGAIIRGAAVKKSFKLAGRGNLAVTITSDVKNGWLFLRGRMINETLGTTRTFGVQVAYHSGYSGGTSWARGGRRRTVFLGSMSPGDYSVTLSPEWSSMGSPPTRFDVALTSGVFIGTHAVVFGVLLWLLPLVQAIRYYGFEKQRWADSDHA